MAPETVGGAGQFSALSDLFAVGTMLLQLIFRMDAKQVDADPLFWLKFVKDAQLR
jgi:hypothetical protein